MLPCGLGAWLWVMEWNGKGLALGSMVVGMELSAWLTWIIGDYTSR